VEYRVEQLTLAVICEIRKCIDLASENLRDGNIPDARELLTGIAKASGALENILEIFDNPVAGKQVTSGGGADEISIDRA